VVVLLGEQVTVKLKGRADVLVSRATLHGHRVRALDRSTTQPRCGGAHAV